MPTDSDGSKELEDGSSRNEPHCWLCMSLSELKLFTGQACISTRPR